VFVQLYGGKTTITASLCGFNDTSKHGWHVHEGSSTENMCAAAGGHFNPHNKRHGAPDDDQRFDTSVTLLLLTLDSASN